MIQDEPRDIDQDWPVAFNRDVARRDLERLSKDGELSQEAAQLVWDYFLAPLYDRRVATYEWPGQRCRRCNAMHPSHKDYDRFPSRQTHAMRCSKYVGPLEHRSVRTDDDFFNAPRHECVCGQFYPHWADEDATVLGTCPDAAVDWRGPRPVQ